MSDALSLLNEKCHQIGCYRDAVETVRDEPCCESHAVLRRAGWRCEAVIEDRLHPGEHRRCPVMGSEIWVVGDQARCPKHMEVPNAA